MSINDNALCNFLLKNVNDTKINQFVFNDALKSLLNEYKKDLPAVSSIELIDKYNHHHAINSPLFEGNFCCDINNTDP
ncbi:unnamed protein product [Cunninghamella echinulata]